MPYTISSARKDFDKVINDLIILSKQVADVKLGHSIEIKQAVYRAAIFQTSAALEEYIKSVFEDWVYLLHKNDKKIKDVPVELIYCIAGKKQLNSFKNYIVDNDEAELIRVLSKNQLLHKLFNNDEKVKDLIYKNEVISDKKYPSVKNIPAIYKRFGINDIFKAMTILGKKDYKLIIKSFSDVRTEIAHQYPSADLAFGSVVEHLKALQDFVNRADRVLYSHVKSISGEDCWQIKSVSPT